MNTKFDGKLSVTVTIPTTVTYQRLSDLLCNAIEGGSNYWCTTIDRKGGITKEQAPYRQDVPFVDGGWLDVDWCDRDDAPVKRIDLEAVKKGLTVMAEKYPQHYSNFLMENDDAETGDVFLQCIVFGDVIYC